MCRELCHLCHLTDSCLRVRAVEGGLACVTGHGFTWVVNVVTTQLKSHVGPLAAAMVNRPSWLLAPHRESTRYCLAQTDQT